MSRHHLAILLLITLCSLSPARARYVDDADEQVVYSRLALPARSLACKLNAAKCTSNWWLERSSRHHNGSLHVTHGPVAVASFSFQGSALALIGSTFARGAKGLIAVDDGAPQIVDFTSPTGARVDGVRLYARSGLDPTVTHTVVLSYDSTSYVPRRDEPRYMAVDAFLVEDSPDAPAVAHPRSPVTLSSRAISSSSGTVLARDDDIPTPSSGSSPTFNDLYADSDETHTSSSPTATSSQWSPVGHSQPASLNAGQIAAIGVVSGVLFVALAFAVLCRLAAASLYSAGVSALSWATAAGDKQLHRRGKWIHAL
ncbi:hypothetical protein EXIGLDRAFT_707395 [Exidia glandulosa HHB12029]|uniref:DOMON domain-containing protein n=1 Tax=Exidia glandulosa HHB12029 TaxID=1314781 RepID=A0A165JVM4_EXIGL|nr:hypothetical protein EXIGLDRAFT_707395 [Exidia glandulosa HHB12029]